MSAYTPGPWHAVAIGTMAHVAQAADSEGRFAIATVYFQNYHPGGLAAAREEQASNARLISQAPAMADLLRAIVADDPLYSDAEEGTFCVHCYAQFSNHKGITHKPDCAYVRANAILATIDNP
jgi:hypothetical protein